ncbi:MAG: ABC transporter ATP-binding protein [Chitinophagaceae bacterium]|nr:MAG: ABC transporter ATP-binding protein [Chitinophagaceae bacterium]
MKGFGRILQYILKYRFYAGLNIIFNLLAILFSLVSLAMIFPFLQILFENEQLVQEKPVWEFSVKTILEYFNYTLSNIIIEYGKPQALLFICILVTIIFFFKNLFRYLALYNLAPIRNGVVKDIRNNLYNKTIHLPLGYYSEEKKGDIISRMTSDVQEVEWGIMSTLEVTFREPVTIITYLGAMLFMSPQLTLFVLLMLLVTGLIVGRIGKSLKKTSTEGQEKMGGLLSIIDETLTGLRVIKAFNAQKLLKEKFQRENHSYFNTVNKMLRRKDLSSPLSEFLGITIVAVVLWFGGNLVLDPDTGLSAEAFITFMVIFSQLIPPAKSFSSAFYNIQKGLASSERIHKILDAPITIKDNENALPKESFEKIIEYKDVQFGYQKEVVLSDINIKIEKGQTIAIVGQSGSGKSTLVDLLPRFYDTNEGAIFIDGENIKNYKLKDLRNLMGVVSQEPILFNDTIYNNITLGLENVTIEKVTEAARIANALPFIEQMENGFETNIGDRGNRLSGGEKQRLTIARAILSDPPILILDEATSSLDTESEKLVQDAISKLMKNRTSLVIAHRLSTIQFADMIYVMQEGRIVEKGNHIGLMSKQNGIYKKLVELQAF